MTAPEPDSPAARQRSEAAAGWLVKHDRGLTAAEQDEFLDWLAADPKHSAWLQTHRQVVGDFSLFAQWRPEHSDEPNPNLLAPAPRRHRWLLPAAALAAAAVAVAVLQLSSPPATPTTPSAIAEAELERRLLADGSSVDLNRGAVVTTAFSPTERRVTLVQGEALFTVTKDVTRPFIVRAAGVDIRAVGTAFNVRLESSSVEVLVTEGIVNVAPPSSAHTSDLTLNATVQAGQRATVATDRPAAPQVAAVSPQTTARLLAWQPQLLDFSSAPLERAVAEFNRRNRVQFVIADPELGTLPIVASIRSDKVEGFAQFLASVPGITVERRGSEEIVLRHKP